MVSHESGQSVVEAVLLIAAFVALTTLVSQQFKEKNIISGIVERPWRSLDGMVKNGVWGTPERTNARHPNVIGRHISDTGD